MIKITSFENHKGGTRIYLKSGRAAYRWVASVQNEVRKAEAELVCGYEGINEKILVLKSQLHEQKLYNDKTLDRFLKPLAEQLINEAGANKVVKHVMRDSNQDEIKHLFKLITEINHDVITLLACVSSEGVFIMFGTNKNNKNIDVRSAFKKAITILDGKGGGSSFSAQGWGKNSVALDAALSEAEKLL